MASGRRAAKRDLAATQQEGGIRQLEHLVDMTDEESRFNVEFAGNY
jgi:hypothetical protein